MIDRINPDTKCWTVLIVDDEPDNLDLAKTVLKFKGAQIHTATNGIEGLAVLEQLMPTFVLLDLSMPSMDGWEMLNRMKASERLRDIPVIALTAHAMEGDRERVLTAGFSGYISKPFRIGSLVPEIRAALGLLAQNS